MNVFQTHSQIINDYATYISSFLNIADPEIARCVERELQKGKLWPEPLLQFNPSFEKYGSLDELTQTGTLHPAIRDIFQGYSLYRHQVDAIKLGTNGKDFVVTSGTGSGKSLTYIGTIFHHLLSHPGTPGVTAVVVYPMNALINSQFDEFQRYKENYENNTGRPFPITFGQYTGQEKEDARERMRENPPQILLTNYMMLELLLTRIRERSLRNGIYQHLRFLVFDELHTYRGRQGADVAMLIRRIRSNCRQTVNCIGTSATMVSIGSIAEQRSAVADVATKLFGKTFTPEQVVNEWLDRSFHFTGTLPTREELVTAIELGVNTEADVSILKSHPIAIWLENKIALATKEGILVRGKPRRITDIVTDLAHDAGLELQVCRAYLEQFLQWISTANKKLQESGQRYTLLPFKLHQFISQTGSVYTTLDQDENRYVTLEPGMYKQDEAENKPIFPNVFSRATGHAFICVARNGNRLEPREFRTGSEEDDEAADGYLIIGPEIWDFEEDYEFLPDSWWRMTKNGPVPDTKKKPFFPVRLYFDEMGNCSERDELKWWGWFMKAPLLFDPTGGVFYDTKTNEGTKLTKLGSEGRSTSTTITAFSILNRLDETGFLQKDQKLLSFTDNRQDAALQSGHFNDFIQVVQLRAAIYKALVNAPNGSLTYASIGEAIFQALGIHFTEFANVNEEPRFASVKREYEQCFQDYLTYRAISDLRRSWRIVLPNLEQCGLLSIDYAGVDEIAADPIWQQVPLLNALNPADRSEFIRTILDFFRLEYAIHSENFLTQSKLKENERHFRERLRPPWTLDHNETLREPFVIRHQQLHRSAKLFQKSMGPSSSLGKFIKLLVRQRDLPIDLDKHTYNEFILELMTTLSEAGFLKIEIARTEQNQQIPVFRLRLDKIVWKKGDGLTVKADAIKQRSYKDLAPRPNEFFQKLYKRDFSRMKRLRGEDHTGQLGTDERIEREDQFRAGDISALFCSPTMELGIDISNLSVVHMRNAPPNPANYAQRSGRAGRSGQAALVFTYCSSYAPHDRHYFNNQEALVAGAVMAPKLDLCNRELLTSHLNALAISEIGLPGLDNIAGAKPSLMRLVVDDNDKLLLDAEIRAGLEILPMQFEELKAAFKRIIHDFKSDLGVQGAAWYSDHWIEQTLSKLTENLDKSLDRWRTLYKSARTILTRATQQIESGKLSLGSDDYRKYKRNQDQATRQLDLLRNDTSGRNTDKSEFYPYRYFASEGFLPGYNFTRLPIRVFLPTSDSSGEFISRPRSIALREFGPLNIIYHGGRKFRVCQLVVQDAESSLTEAKVSTKAGYYLTGEAMKDSTCPFSGENLGDNANKEELRNLMEMTESRAEEIDRISCEEEERTSRGYKIDTYFSVDSHLSRIRKATAFASDQALLNIRYIPTARLYHVNSQWRSQQTAGFPLGMTSGNWRPSTPSPEDNFREDFQLVKLQTSNLADALYLEPIQALGLRSDGVITLQYAIKRAIEEEFQVEPNELGVVSLGRQEAPNILLYEAAEGSLGILSQFVEDVHVFHRVIQRAIAICHFDDAEYKGPASYDDLLSYYNQRDHRVINRHLIQDGLEKLSICSIEIQTNSGFQNYEEHFQAMRRALDPTSSTELKFIEYLYQNGLRLPDSAQERVEGIYVQPDFYYHPRIWVFCDGTPHDDPAVQIEDEAKRQAIMARGDEVWVYHYRENLTEKIAARPDIFRKVR